MIRLLANPEVPCGARSIVFGAAALALSACLCGTIFAQPLPDRAPANKTWEEVTAHFASLRADQMLESRIDGALLREISPERTLSFLAGFLSKDQPQAMRVHALCALGAAAIPESAAIVESLALDRTEDPKVRHAALWPTLAKFDKDRARAIGISCLRDPERTVRLGAYSLLGNVGGNAAVAALQRQFLTNADRERAAVALGSTKEPSAIKFLVKHSPLEELRRNRDRRDAFVHAMATTPTRDALRVMTDLADGADCYLIQQALPYFRAFHSPEIGPDLVAYFEDGAARRRRLPDYHDLWFFANSRALGADSTARLRALVKEINPDAQFDLPAADPGEIDDETLGAAIAATFGSGPLGLARGANLTRLRVNGRAAPAKALMHLQGAGYSVEPADQGEMNLQVCSVRHVRRLGERQIVLHATFSSVVSAFLLVRENDNWVVAKREDLGIKCL